MCSPLHEASRFALHPALSALAVAMPVGADYPQGGE